LYSHRVLIACAFAMLPVAILAPRTLSAVLAIAAIAMAARSARTWRHGWRAERGLWLLGGVLLWALLSIAWVGDPAQGFERWIKLALGTALGVALLSGAATLDGRARRWIGGAVAAGVALGFAYMALDLALQGAPRRWLLELPGYYSRAGLNRGLTVAMLMIWPAGLWLWRWRRWAAVALFALCVAVLSRTESDSATAAFGLGAVTFALALAAPRAVALVLAVATAAAVLLAPLAPMTVLRPDMVAAVAPNLPSPGVHRLYIWAFTAERIAERPILGWGLDASRGLPGKDTTLPQVNPALNVETYGQMTLLPLHPHNAALQFWLELGLPGALALALLIGGLLLRVRRLPDRAGAAVATTTLMVGLSLSSFSYGMWQGWWLAALWLTAAFTVIAVAPREPPARG